MHFFYNDESGDTGRDLQNEEQPIFVLGGVSLSDEKWNNTQQEFTRIVNEYYEDEVPENFELHATELLSPNGNGPFVNHSMEARTQFAKDILNLVVTQSHNIHLIGFDKQKIHDTDCGARLAFHPSRPYQLSLIHI